MFVLFAPCRQRLYVGFYMKTLKEDQKQKTSKLVNYLVVFVTKINFEMNESLFFASLPL